MLIDDDELALCSPVRLELLYAARGKGDYRSLARDLQGFRNLPIDERAEAAAGDTQARLASRSQHRGPTPTDLLIAAVAKVHGAILLHYDRHFELIAGVTGQPTEWLVRPGSVP